MHAYILVDYDVNKIIIQAGGCFACPLLYEVGDIYLLD